VIHVRVLRVDFDGYERAGSAVPLENVPDTEFDGDEELEQEYPLVVVTWRDAFFDFDQKDAGDCRADYLVHTVGFLLAEGPKFVSLAQEVLPDGDGFRAVTHIPVSIVERVAQLTIDVDTPASD
jgi:hypothetical protein